MFNKAYLNVQLALKVINDISRVLLSQKVIILKRPTCITAQQLHYFGI